MKSIIVALIILSSLTAYGQSNSFMVWSIGSNNVSGRIVLLDSHCIVVEESNSNLAYVSYEEIANDTNARSIILKFSEYEANRMWLPNRLKALSNKENEINILENQENSLQYQKYQLESERTKLIPRPHKGAFTHSYTDWEPMPAASDRLNEIYKSIRKIDRQLVTTTQTIERVSGEYIEIQQQIGQYQWTK